MNKPKSKNKLGGLIKMTRYLKLFVLIALVILLVTSHSSAFDSSTFNRNTQPLKPLRITPSGEDVPPGRQIVFQFSRPVVPVGRMDRDASKITITIAPELECQWRWLNTSALARQLDEKLYLITGSSEQKDPSKNRQDARHNGSRTWRVISSLPRFPRKG
jgi:hypothetical protein